MHLRKTFEPNSSSIWPSSFFLRKSSTTQREREEAPCSCCSGRHTNSAFHSSWRTCWLLPKPSPMRKRGGVGEGRGRKKMQRQAMTNSSSLLLQLRQRPRLHPPLHQLLLRRPAGARFATTFCLAPTRKVRAAVEGRMGEERGDQRLW